MLLGVVALSVFSAVAFAATAPQYLRILVAKGEATTQQAAAPADTVVYVEFKGKAMRLATSVAGLRKAKALTPIRSRITAAS